MHKTRVASRRLRAALPIFRHCFSSKEFKSWSKEIKKVTQLLGEARDLDVQIAFIEGYMKKNPAQKKGISLLLRNHQDQRNQMQPAIVDGLNELKTSGILNEIIIYCQKNLNWKSTSLFDANQVLEKAQWHISFRLDEFLAMEKYVHSPNEIKRHHEMRIAAKKLRYTMEFFSPLYKAQLKAEIETVKKYQDILGEKHDFEVWIDYIPRFIATNKSKKRRVIIDSKTEQALKQFLAYIKQQRQECYDQFVELWDENKNSHFFEKLRETMKAGKTMKNKKVQHQTLKNSNVAIGVLSDIHANLQALERVFEDAEKRGISIFLNAGDSIGFGASPNEVLELLCEKSVLSIVGNYDLEVLEGKKEAKSEKEIALNFARKELSKTSRSYLESLPRELRLEVAGKTLLVTHGSPKSIEEHIYHDTPTKRLKALANTAQADILIVGHSHEQFQREIEGTYFVNPGSVGRPGDGNPQTAYAILRFNPFTVELVRLDYDVEAAAHELRRKGLPESFAQMLLRGVSLDQVIEDDAKKQSPTIQDCRTKVQASEDFSKNCWPDSDHYSQVTQMALALFDGLTELHHLSEQERCWLECASILHDVGLSKSGGSHHKKSAEIILNNTQLPLPSTDRRIIACIARYHRKGLPKPKHYILAGLNPKTTRKIKVLSSLLRVADSLDYNHESDIKKLNLKIGTKRVFIEVVSSSKSMLEEQSFNKKKDLFEKVFKKKMVLKWKIQ